jgi:hypothetical protein
MKAYPRAIRRRASVLLTAAAALIIETSCSEAPPPQSAPQPTSSPSEIRSRLELYARDKAIIRIHTDDGTIIPTAFYSLTDSSVVIDHVLRGQDYIPELTEAHLYGDRKAKELPDGTTFPLRVPMDRIVALQSWNFPSRPAAVGEEVGPRLAVYAAEKVVARIHTTDGTIIPTSHYALVDSVIVISDVLRDRKYFPEDNQPRVHGIASAPVKKLPPDLNLPLTVPVTQVSTVDQWQDPHKTRKGIVTGVVVVAAVALVAWFMSDFEIGLSGDGEWQWR